MPATQPEAAVATKVANALGSGWAVDTNVFASLEVPKGAGVPQRAIFCAAYEEAVTPFIGVAQDLYEPRVQVLVRSERGDQAGGLAAARSVRDSLHRAELDGYFSALVLSGPIPLGRGDDESYRWSVNVQLRYVE